MQCALFTAIPMSLLVYTLFADDIFASTRILAYMTVCQLRFLSVLSSAKNASWMISLWSEATWSYSGGISGGSRSSSARNERNYLKFTTSHSPWAYPRELSPLKVSALDSHIYFPHQTRHKPFKMMLLTSECEIKTTARFWGSDVTARAEKRLGVQVDGAGTFLEKFTR